MKHSPLIINIDTPILQNWSPTEVRAKVALVLGDVGLGIRGKSTMAHLICAYKIKKNQVNQLLLISVSYIISLKKMPITTDNGS